MFLCKHFLWHTVNNFSIVCFYIVQKATWAIHQQWVWKIWRVLVPHFHYLDLRNYPIAVSMLFYRNYRGPHLDFQPHHFPYLQAPWRGKCPRFYSPKDQMSRPAVEQCARKDTRRRTQTTDIVEQLADVHYSRANSQTTYVR